MGASPPAWVNVKSLSCSHREGTNEHVWPARGNSWKKHQRHSDLQSVENNEQVKTVNCNFTANAIHNYYISVCTEPKPRSGPHCGIPVPPHPWYTVPDETYEIDIVDGN